MCSEIVLLSGARRSNRIDRGDRKYCEEGET